MDKPIGEGDKEFLLLVILALSSIGRMRQKDISIEKYNMILYDVFRKNSVLNVESIIY